MHKTNKNGKNHQIDQNGLQPNNPHPTLSGSEEPIHINLHKEVITGYQLGIKGLKGT
jgi:hypothetical protein